MDSETASSVDEQQGGSGSASSAGGGGPDNRGKHRVFAELKRVEQEVTFLQDELEVLEKTDNVSTVCDEWLRNVESIPDPLLPLTNGPLNPSWDRWFEGPQDSKGCQCQIL